MKLKECPSCAMDIDEKAQICPICGYEFPQKQRYYHWIAIILAVIFILFLLL